VQSALARSKMKGNWRRRFDITSSQEQRLSPNAELSTPTEIFAEGWRLTKAVFALKGMEITHTIRSQADGARQHQETRTKPEIVALLSRCTLKRRARWLVMTCSLNLCGRQAGLDDIRGQRRVPPMPLVRRFAEKQSKYALSLYTLSAPDCLPRLSIDGVAS
jgi:hypothetical protein